MLEDVRRRAAELSGYGYQEEELDQELDAHAAQGVEEARAHAHGALPARAAAHLPGLGRLGQAFQAPGCDELGASQGPTGGCEGRPKSPMLRPSTPRPTWWLRRPLMTTRPC